MGKINIEALESVSVKLDFKSKGIAIDLTPEEHDALSDLRNWIQNSCFDCPKCGTLVFSHLIRKNTNKEKNTFICPFCSKESNIAELK